MRNHRDQIIKEFTEFRIGMEKQRLHGGGHAPGFLVNYESGKLTAVKTFPLEKFHWLWEITGDELTLTFIASGLGLFHEVFHFKRV
jgi:hypothetical protein